MVVQYWGDHPELFASISKGETPEDRLLSATRWFISTLYGSYSSRSTTAGMERKPYNPILGEQYFAQWTGNDEIGTTVLKAEQVSHHPPIMGFHLENKRAGVILEGHCGQKSRFALPAGIDVLQTGHAILTLPQFNETYLVTLPTLNIHGLITRKPAVELSGTTYIVSSVGQMATIKYSTRGYFSGEKNSFKAELMPLEGGDAFYTAQGVWSKVSTYTSANNPKKTFLFFDSENDKGIAPEIKPTKEMGPLESHKLWAKVTHAINTKDYAMASKEKTQIEEAQRVLARTRKEKGETQADALKVFVLVDKDSDATGRAFAALKERLIEAVGTKGLKEDENKPRWRSTAQGVDKDIMTLPTTNPRRHAYKPIVNQPALASSSAATSLATLAIVKSAIRRNIYFIVFTIFVFVITLYICLTFSYKAPPKIPHYIPLLPLERRPVQPPLRRPYSKTPAWIGSWLSDRKLNQRDAQQLAKSLRFDLVYTWVNGSDPSLARMKKKYQDLSPMFNPPPANQSATITIKGRMDWPMKDNRKNKGRGPKVDPEAINRYRDMNELQYSVRSVAENASPGLFHRIHILTTSVPDEFDERRTIGQVPAWLDQRLGQETIRLVEHKNIYDNLSVLPSFNSLSIESQMHHIPELSEIFMYLNDDVFFGTQVRSTDLWTPLYGFVFHMDPATILAPEIPAKPEYPTAVGEWENLLYTNYLLSKQFGSRHRVYLHHIPHILSSPILNEIQQIWPEEFAETSSHRFRGENDAKEIQVSFMLAHYVMERQRETQLASYWAYRLDTNQDGALSWTEREQLINKIDRYHQRVESRKKSSAVSPHILSVYNSFLDGHKELLEQVDLPLSGSTTYELSGLDGYPFGARFANTSRSANELFKRPFRLSHNNRTCIFDIDFCLGVEFRNRTAVTMSASTGKGSVFERIAFKEFHCGDCLLTILRENDDNVSGAEETSGLLGAILPLDRASDAFSKVITDMTRYNYVIGESETAFLQLKSLVPAQAQLKQLLADRARKLFFCINDNVENSPLIVRKVKDEFSKFLQARFPVASPWEV
ncbi:Oxysterol binding protein [Podila minutissima]|uniref:Oxysterol binding protein n=1 Tax=Podila minutissima TaxID=64525 RepID=A0A9P5SJT0_9FUNG|nr:Oxysterol binding protein [Podila minutissima]